MKKLVVVVSVELSEELEEVLEELRWKHIDVISILQPELEEYVNAWVSGWEG